MIDNWIIVLNLGTDNEEVYCVNNTHYDIVHSWAKYTQKEKNQEPVIFPKRILKISEHFTTINLKEKIRLSLDNQI